MAEIGWMVDKRRLPKWTLSLYFSACQRRSYELGMLEDLEARLSIVERMNEPKGA